MPEIEWSQQSGTLGNCYRIYANGILFCVVKSRPEVERMVSMSHYNWSVASHTFKWKAELYYSQDIGF